MKQNSWKDDFSPFLKIGKWKMKILIKATPVSPPRGWFRPGSQTPTWVGFQCGHLFSLPTLYLSSKIGERYSSSGGLRGTSSDTHAVLTSLKWHYFKEREEEVESRKLVSLYFLLRFATASENEGVLLRADSVKTRLYQSPHGTWKPREQSVYGILIRFCFKCRSLLLDSPWLIK